MSAHRVIMYKMKESLMDSIDSKIATHKKIDCYDSCLSDQDWMMTYNINHEILTNIHLTLRKVASSDVGS